MLHFGMTGRLRYSRQAHEAHPHDAACFRFENGAMLEYVMPRKLGRLALTDSIGDFIADRRLGPDALAVDEATLGKLAGGRCPRCGGEIEKKKVAGRTCWFCPQCQPAVSIRK